KIGPDPRNFNQRVSLGRNDLLIRTFPKEVTLKENINASSITWKVVNDYGGAGSLYSSSL
ncbi:hypothetical protein LQQ51_19595, partial [Klebsiella pneumoniae]|nr:hypothetical protein [Klebsiella pneumoniae]MCD1157186.1 hypothetical protein [Klebsiella pneumoniae]